MLNVAQELHDTRDSLNKTVEHRLNADSVSFQFALTVCTLRNDQHITQPPTRRSQCSASRDSSRRQCASCSGTCGSCRQTSARSAYRTSSKLARARPMPSTTPRRRSAPCNRCSTAPQRHMCDACMQAVAAANAECAGIHKMFKAHQNFAQNIRDAGKTQAEKACD